LKNQDPPRPDSARTKRALLPSRIEWWRKCGNEEQAQKLEQELAELENAQ
jgi:hypothetical protein